MIETTHLIPLQIYLASSANQPTSPKVETTSSRKAKELAKYCLEIITHVTTSLKSYLAHSKSIRKQCTQLLKEFKKKADAFILLKNAKEDPTRPFDVKTLQELYTEYKKAHRVALDRVAKDLPHSKQGAGPLSEVHEKYKQYQSRFLELDTLLEQVGILEQSCETRRKKIEKELLSLNALSQEYEVLGVPDPSLNEKIVRINQTYEEIFDHPVQPLPEQQEDELSPLHPFIRSGRAKELEEMGLKEQPVEELYRIPKESPRLYPELQTTKGLGQRQKSHSRFDFDESKK